MIHNEIDTSKAVIDWLSSKKAYSKGYLIIVKVFYRIVLPNRAEIDLSPLHIDGSVYDYLKATILEYYL